MPELTAFVSRWLGAPLILSLATGCLPGDTRPEPGTVYVTAEPSEALTAGVTTADGWKVVFDRLVLAIGNVGFENDDASCNSYAEARYDRLFDFTVAGREKVATVFGLGTCAVDFRFRAPSFDALLGEGTTADDVATMRIEDSDRYADEQRTAVIARGSATRGDVEKRFDWVFRDGYKIVACEAEDGTSLTKVELVSARQGELRIEVRGEELFRAAANDAADRLFSPIADADSDADGEVTMDELSNAPRPMVGIGTAKPNETGSHEQLLYEELLPRLVSVVGAKTCEVEERDGG